MCHIKYDTSKQFLVYNNDIEAAVVNKRSKFACRWHTKSQTALVVMNTVRNK